MQNGMVECSVCHSKLLSPTSRTVSRAYDRHRTDVSSKSRVLNILLVVGDCILVGLQPILVYMSKVDGKFMFSPISVNFLTEAAKVIFAIVMLLIQGRRKKVGEKSLLSVSTFVQAARNNVLLAVPALLYAINNYLKFVMQLYFNPATVKMLSNLKVLVIAILLKIIMKRQFSIIQWEALALLLIGISVNQLKSLPEGTTALGLPVGTGAYLYTLIFVTVPSMASVFNEYALKSQFETSIYLQNLFLYGYGAMFNFLAILGIAIFKGPGSLDILQGHSKATMLLICNNAAQGILSSFFFKYAGSNMSEKRTIDDVVKKDREYWTAVMDDALIDALLHQHHLGNRNGSVFTTHAYDNIVKELQEKFEKPIDKQKVKNRIKTIKSNWSDCYDVFKNGLSGFAWSPITKMWSAEPEVWESLIQAKPKAKELKNKPIPNYDKLVELYGKDRATGEQAETASEMRQRWATSIGEGSMENIEDIDHVVAQNEVTLESCDNVGDNNVGEASSKAKKRKTSKNEDMEQIMGAIQNVASAMRDGNLIFERSMARLPIPEQEVFHLLDEIGIDSRLQTRAYLYLIKNPDMLRAFIGYPMEKRKELLFTMMSDS